MNAGTGATERQNALKELEAALREPDLAVFSDLAIADLVGVSRWMVGLYRRRLELSEQISPVTVRMCRDGSMRDITKLVSRRCQNTPRSHGNGALLRSRDSGGCQVVPVF